MGEFDDYGAVALESGAGIPHKQNKIQRHISSRSLKDKTVFTCLLVIIIPHVHKINMELCTFVSIFKIRIAFEKTGAQDSESAWGSDYSHPTKIYFILFWEWHLQFRWFCSKCGCLNKTVDVLREIHIEFPGQVVQRNVFSSASITFTSRIYFSL